MFLVEDTVMEVSIVMMAEYTFNLRLVPHVFGVIHVNLLLLSHWMRLWIMVILISRVQGVCLSQRGFLWNRNLNETSFLVDQGELVSPVEDTWLYYVPKS